MERFIKSSICNEIITYISVSKVRHPILQVTSTKPLGVSLVFSSATEGKQDSTFFTLPLPI